MSNREVVSDVFSMLLEDKRNTLNVYNGLNDKTYDDPAQKQKRFRRIKKEQKPR